jgi:protein tyrosine/serine phosphatase
MKWVILRRIRRAAIVAVSSLGLILAASGGLYAYWQAGGNFHEVEAGRYYRSAQLDASDLDQAIKKYGIRSVLNLRGENRGNPWYDSEVATTRKDGVPHLDYRISARRPVTVVQMREIVAILREAPKPILVHCQQGADRTGLVSALYLLSRGADAAVAEQELSLLRYGHFPYLGSKTRAMDESLQTYVAASRPNESTPRIQPSR